MYPYRRLVVAALLVALAAGPLLTGLFVVAQEPRQPAASDAQADRFAVPETDDVAELMTFLQRISGLRPATQAEARQFREKAPAAMQAAARRIVELEKDKTSEAYRLARRILLSVESQKVAMEGEPGQQKVMLEDLLKFVRDGKREAGDLQVAVQYASTLEYEGDKTVAAEAYDKFGSLFAEAREEEIARYGRMMQGAARRLRLVGQPLALKGQTLDGKDFDLAALKGKVVLVDFWATWCGPCLQEHPNIERQYEAYKDKGFEVVGVSIDQDRAALEEFVERKKTPWITLHDKKNQGQHPATIDYGIFGIPAMFLIDQEGKVVSTQARGEELARLLKELLGENQP